MRTRQAQNGLDFRGKGGDRYSGGHAERPEEAEREGAGCQLSKTTQACRPLGLKKSPVGKNGWKAPSSGTSASGHSMQGCYDRVWPTSAKAIGGQRARHARCQATPGRCHLPSRDPLSFTLGSFQHSLYHLPVTSSPHCLPARSGQGRPPMPHPELPSIVLTEILLGNECNKQSILSGTEQEEKAGKGWGG